MNQHNKSASFHSRKNQQQSNNHHHSSASSSSSSNNSTTMFSRTIHIGNIASYTTVESLQVLFSKFGQVTNIKLAGDPSYAKRFAFVEFVDHHQAKSSLSLDGTEFMGQLLKISMAKHDFNSKQQQNNSVIPSSNSNNSNNNSNSNNNNHNINNNGLNLTPLVVVGGGDQKQQQLVVSFPSTPPHHPPLQFKKKTDPQTTTTRKKKSTESMTTPEISNTTTSYLSSPSPIYMGGLSPLSSSNSSSISNNIALIDTSNSNNNSAASRTVHISGIDPTFSEDELLEFFSVYGDITNYRLCNTNNDQVSSNSSSAATNQLQSKFAFIEYATTDQSLKAMMVNGTLWGSFKLKVSHSKTAIQTPPKKSLLDKQYRDLVERTIHVGGIDVKLSQDHVKSFFEELCGTIHRIAMAGDTESYETRFCFIEFEDKQSSLRALRLGGCTIAGSVKQIKVSPSKSPIGYSKNKLMMIMGSNSSSAPPSPLHHQLNQLNLNTPPTLSPHHHHHHHQLHTSTPPSSITTTVLPNGMVAMAIPPNALTPTTASNITTTTTTSGGATIYNTSQQQNTATTFPTVFPYAAAAQWALTQPSQQMYTTTTPQQTPNHHPSNVVLTNHSQGNNQQSIDTTQASFITYPQMIHPQYYFYTTNPQFPYLAIPPNYTINTNMSNQDVNNIHTIEEDSENVKRKRDQHETLDETSNVLYQKKLKDK